MFLFFYSKVCKVIKKNGLAGKLQNDLPFESRSDHVRIFLAIYHSLSVSCPIGIEPFQFEFGICQRKPKNNQNIGIQKIKQKCSEKTLLASCSIRMAFRFNHTKQNHSLVNTRYQSFLAPMCKTPI